MRWLNTDTVLRKMEEAQNNIDFYKENSEGKEQWILANVLAENIRNGAYLINLNDYFEKVTVWLRIIALLLAAIAANLILK